MGAQIKIDQVGLSAGVADRSRSDGLSTGAVVTLTSADPGATNEFSFLWVPDDDTTAVASLSNLGTTATFTPTIGATGTYRILLTVDEGLPTESYSIRTFSVRTPVLGLRKPALNERASPHSSLVNNSAVYIDQSETNEASGSGPFASGGYGGFYESMMELYDAVDDLAGEALTLSASAPANVTRSSASSGVSSTASRSDHKHDVSTAAPTQGIGAGNTEGSSSSLARADHNHKLRTGSTDLTLGTISDGQFVKRVGTELVSAPLTDPTTAAPTQGIGAGNTEGVASTFAKSDHDHKLRTGSTDLTIGTVTDGEFLKRSGTTIISAPAGLTVKDEGSTLSTAVTSIDFVGGGVTASGTTSATVTIPQGGRVTARRTVTGPASAVLATTDHFVFVDTSGGAVTLTLPTPVGSDSIYEIVDITGSFGTNACTIARNAVGDYIGGLQASYVLEAPWQAIGIASDNVSKWYLL